MSRLRIAAALVVLLTASRALAWNALGHKVIADIAWQQLTEAERKHVVETLHRHPKYAEQFANQRNETVADEDRWLFQHTATWADRIRGDRAFDNPTWHYVDFPIFIGPERPVTFNRETQPKGDRKQWNVMQAIAYCRGVLASDAPPGRKALAYCWIFHLVGDLHQPLHSTALVGDMFPNPALGDKGGNGVLVVQGRNLHSLWDNLLGRQDRMADVAREVKELQAHKQWWTVDTTVDVPAWIADSHEAAKSFVYTPEILAGVQQPGELTPISLSEGYLKAAGERARPLIVMAGLRLAAVLRESTGHTGVDPADASQGAVDPLADDPFGASLAPPQSQRPPTPGVPAAASYWLNLNGNVRHNAACKWYENTKRGRPCSADEGRACGQCGG